MLPWFAARKKVETIVLTFIFLATLFLAYANGSNDNFKGVATLYGSSTTDYKSALAWATLTTALGSVMTLYLAGELIIVFKGKGLVPENIIQMQNFQIAISSRIKYLSKLAQKI